MKMKKACELTFLTERAIRLYLKKGLLSPRHTNGLIDFSEEDILRLQDIATLRQLDFTIEQISSMLRDPSSIAEIARIRAENARHTEQKESETASALLSVQGKPFVNMHSFAAHLRLYGSAYLRGPDFGRFDELSDPQRRREILVALGDLPSLIKRAHRMKAAAIAACVAVCLAVIVALFFGHTRVCGYIATGPLTVLHTGEGNTAAVRFDDSSLLAQLLGENSITVPWKSALFPSAGATYENGCALAVDLTNLDLLRLGVSPLQPLHTQSEQMNEDLMRLVLRALFRSPEPHGAALYIREYPNCKPLLNHTR